MVGTENGKGEKLQSWCAPRNTPSRREFPFSAVTVDMTSSRFNFKGAPYLPILVP